MTSFWDRHEKRANKERRESCVVDFLASGYSHGIEPERRPTGFRRDSGGARSLKAEKTSRSLNAAEHGTVDVAHLPAAHRRVPLSPRFTYSSSSSSSPLCDHRLSDGPASQRPELHQSRGRFVLRGRPDGALHEPVHPLYHRHPLRALTSPGGDRGGSET